MHKLSLGGLKDRRTASEAVAESLRSAIRSGSLADGSELNQVALAEHFGVSRVPVREAMRQLQAEGWITARPHHRAVVQALSPERILEILELRALLEAHLIVKSIPKIGDQRLARLERLCEQMDRLTDHQRWLEANRAFHRELYEDSGAETTIELVEQLNAQVERYVRTRGDGIDRGGEAGAEHRAIIAAVRERDAHAAKHLIEAHIERTRQLVALRIEEKTRHAATV
ncbi:MAG TPA: GntR family transcriptional regulator [Candidatus Binatia bacterium]|nr:GntR family transcriptional regulator [Candidatus Binatia bacterium]